MTSTASHHFAPGDRAVVAVDVPDTWVGPIAAGTRVTITPVPGPGALSDGEDYTAELADGRMVSFAAAELAPAPRPRKVKIYRVDPTTAFIADPLRQLAGFPSHNRQGEIYIAAPTKAAAVARLAELDMRQSPAAVKIAMGSSYSALRDAGVLAEDGDVVTFHHAVRDNAVTRVAAGTGLDAAQVCGTWRYYDHPDSRTPWAGPRHASGSGFLELADGRLFPIQSDNAPATPATGWTQR